MRYDRNNLLNPIKKDIRNYPCPRCGVGSFAFKDLDYLLGGPVIVNVCCSQCRNPQKIKFHINVI